MSSRWYCRINGTEYGPVESEQLREMVLGGRLTPESHVRKGDVGDWVIARRVRGLFDGVPDHQASGVVAVASPPPRPPKPIPKPMPHIRSIDDCISPEERKRRIGVALISSILWLFLIPIAISLTIATLGFALIFVGLGWLVKHLLAEYNVRKLQALGTTATKAQFPEVTEALAAACAVLGVTEPPKVIILNESSINAFALKFARKKVIVLLSQTLEGIIDQPEQLRFILGHELAHIVLDHGFRGTFELYKPAAYRSARELTCDNCGCAVAGDLEASKTMLKRTGVGNQLHDRLNESFLMAEAQHLNSGLTGWLLKQYLSHPPLGQRLANVMEFCAATPTNGHSAR